MPGRHTRVVDGTVRVRLAYNNTSLVHTLYVVQGQSCSFLSRDTLVALGIFQLINSIEIVEPKLGNLKRIEHTIIFADNTESCAI